MHELSFRDVELRDPFDQLSDTFLPLLVCCITTLPVEFSVPYNLSEDGTDVLWHNGTWLIELGQDRHYVVPPPLTMSMIVSHTSSSEECLRPHKGLDALLVQHNFRRVVEGKNVFKTHTQ